MDTLAEHNIYGSVGFTARNKKEFKSGATHEDFKCILIDNVGHVKASELMEDLTVRSRHCIWGKKKHYSDGDYCCVTCRSSYVQLLLMQEMQIFAAL